MTDTKPSILDQRWKRSGYYDIQTEETMGCWVTDVASPEIAAHIVQLHNADLDRKTPNQSER